MLVASYSAWVSGATIPNLEIGLDIPSLAVQDSSSNQIANNLQLSADIQAVSAIVGIGVGFPDGVNATSNEISGGEVIIAVDTNTVEGLVKGNELALLGGLPTIDLGVVNGEDASSAATAGSLQIIGESEVFASLDEVETRVDTRDLGANSNASLSANTSRAAATANASEQLLAGNINSNYTSTELGQARTLDGEIDILEAGAGYLAANAQLAYQTPTAASVSDTRIGMSATTPDDLDDDTESLQRVQLAADDNTIAANARGNQSSTGVEVKAGEDTWLEGTVGAVNHQQVSTDPEAEEDNTVTATVSGSRIELGDTVEIEEELVDVPIADMVGGGSVSFTGNTTEASATANDAATSVEIAAVIDIYGIAERDQLVNTVDFLDAPEGEVVADVYAANWQVNDSDAVLASVSADSDQRVLLSALNNDDVGNPSVAVDENRIVAGAGGNAALNSINLLGTDIDGALAINSNQLNYSDASASNAASLLVDIGNNTDVVDPSRDDDVIGAAISVSDNDIEASATGNSESSRLEILAGSVTGEFANQAAQPPIFSNRPDNRAEVLADVSVLSAQTQSGGAILSSVSSSIDVNVVDPGTEASTILSQTALIVQGNEISALSAANMVTANTLSIDADQVVATVALANVQTVRDDVQVNAIVTDDGTSHLVEVTVGAGEIDHSTSSVDSNTISAQAYGNIVDELGGNAIYVEGTSVSDTTMAFDMGAYGYVNVLRGASLTETRVMGGVSLLNDQLFLDGGDFDVLASVAASENQLIESVVGDDDTTESINFFAGTANFNVVLAAATVNEATNRVSVGSAGTTSLNTSTTLANLQGLQPLEGQYASSVDATVDNDIQVSVLGEAVDLYDSTFSVYGNTSLAAARANRADNTIQIEALTQYVTGAHTTKPFDNIDFDARPMGPESDSILGPYFDPDDYDTESLGEINLFNDQSLAALERGITATNLSDTVLYVDLGDDEDGTLDSGRLVTDNNTITALAIGNDANNLIDVRVQFVDLSLAFGGPDFSPPDTRSNGPYITLASNQQALDPAEGAVISAHAFDNEPVVIVENADEISDTALIVEDNRITALATANRVDNRVSYVGHEFINLLHDLPPSIRIHDQDDEFGDGALVISNAGIAVGASQVNEYEVTSNVDNLAQAMIRTRYMDGPIDNSAFSVERNALLSRARGNESTNAVAVDLHDAQVSIAMGNYQHNEADITANLQDGQRGVPAAFVEAGSPGSSLDGSSILVKDNSLVAGAGANATVNNIGVTGSVIGSGANTRPQGWINTSDKPFELNADNGIGNYQESGTLSGAAITAVVDEVIVGFSAYDVLEAAIEVTDNDINALANINAASNRISLDAAVSVGLGDEEEYTSAGIISQQLAAGSVSAAVNSAIIGTTTEFLNITTTLYDIYASPVGDLSDEKGAAITVSGNTIMAAANVSTVDNTIDVEAGTSIFGWPLYEKPMEHNWGTPLPLGQQPQIDVFPVPDVPSQTAILSDNELFANADYFIINDQQSSADASAVVDTAQYGEGVFEGDDVDLESPRIGFTVDGSANNDALEVNDNRIAAVAGGQRALNRIDLDAPVNIEASAQIVSRQVNSGNVSAAVTGVPEPFEGDPEDAPPPETINIGIEVGDGTTALVDSSAEVVGNTIEALAVSNIADSKITYSGLNRLGSGEAPILSISNEGVIDAHAQAMILQYQNANGGSTNASINAEETNIGIVLNGSVVGSSVVIRDNTVRAQAQTNVLLNNDASSNAVANNSSGVALPNYQFMEGASATTLVQNVNYQIDVFGSLENVNLEVSDVSILGITGGNTAENTATLSAGGELIGSAKPRARILGDGTITANGQPDEEDHSDEFPKMPPEEPIDGVTADAVILNSQVIEGQGETLDIQVSDVSVGIASTGGATGSQLSVKDNTIDVATTGNLVRNDLTVSAGTNSSAAAVIASYQRADDINVTAGVENFSALVAAGDAATSQINVTGNELSADAIANRAINDLSYKAGGAVIGETTTVAGANIDSANLATLFGDDIQADVTLLNVQRSQASNTEVLVDGINMGVVLSDEEGRGLVGSEVDIKDNTAELSAYTNQGVNNLALEAGTSNSASAVLESSQDGVNTVTTADLVGFNAGLVSLGGETSGSNIEISGNRGKARAQLNVVGNLLDIQAGTALDSQGATLTVTDLAGHVGIPLYADGVQADVVLVNLQKAQDAFTAASASTNIFSLQEGGQIAGTVMTIADNGIQAQAVNNASLNALTQTAGAGSRAGAALINQQVSAGGVVSAMTGNAIIAAGALGGATDVVGSNVQIRDNEVSAETTANLAWNGVVTETGADYAVASEMPEGMEDEIQVVEGQPEDVPDNMAVNIVAPQETTLVTNNQGATVVNSQQNSSVVESFVGAPSVEEAGVTRIGLLSGGERVGSTIAVDDNTVRSLAVGNDAVNMVDVKAGVDSGATNAEGIIGNATAGVTSAQSQVNAAVLADVGGSVRIGTGSVGTNTSDISVSGNQVVADAKGSSASNKVSKEAGSDVNGAGYSAGLLVGMDGIPTETAEIILGQLDLDAAPFAEQVGDATVANSQTGTNSLVASSIASTEIFAASGEAPITASGISVDGNAISSSAISNEAGNLVTLTAGTGITSDAGIGNYQDNYANAANAGGAGSVALVRDVQVGIGSRGPVEDSTLTVNGNEITAEATSNNASNRIEYDTDGSIITGAGAFGSGGRTGLVDVRNLDTELASPLHMTAAASDQDVFVANLQDNTNILSLAEIRSVSMEVDIRGDVDASVIAVSDNKVEAKARGNDAANSIELTSQDILASGAIASNQESMRNFEGAGAIATIEDITAGLYGADAVGSSVLMLTGNEITATAHTNSVVNLVTVEASNRLNAGGTNVNPLLAGPQPQPLGEEVDFAYVAFAGLTDADMAIVSLQTAVNALTVASISGAVITAESANTMTVTAVNISENAVVAEAAVNQATNLVDVSAVNDLDVSVAIITTQSSVENAELGLPPQTVASISDVLLGMEVNGEVSTMGGDVNVADNEISATAVSNSSANAINYDGVNRNSDSTATVAVGGTRPDTGASSWQEASGQLAIVNNQFNRGGSTSATIDNATIGGALNGNSVGGQRQIGGNTIEATAIGNDSYNSIALNNGNYSSPASVIDNNQLNENHSVSASISGARIGVDGVGGPMGTNIRSIGGNSISATAIGNRAVNVVGTP